jgi:hypothetical protein
MNQTMNNTNITVTTTTAKANTSAIQKRIEFDARGQARVVEYLRGIRL